MEVDEPIRDAPPDEGLNYESATGHEDPDHQLQTAKIILRVPRRNDSLPPVAFGDLPRELVHRILSFLPAPDLGCISVTCRSMLALGTEDSLWAGIVNSNLPQPVFDPGPFESFRRLYLAHFSYWFIPKHKIWFSDQDGIGSLILARYDNRRGVIDGYRIIAQRPVPYLHLWAAHPNVLVPSFDPQVMLWLDDPVILFKDPDPKSPVSACQLWKQERQMTMSTEAHHLFNSLLLCSKDRPQEKEDEEPRQTWPPSTIPAENWVNRDWKDHVPPEKPGDVSEWVFRIRRWAHFRFALTPGYLRDNEAIFTWSTLDPALYTPTPEKPYQGIWVGDYSAHGCEFLLIFQRDRALFDEHDEGGENYGGESIAMADGAIQKGSLEAIKLTGDANVPRGEPTFRAKDIGPRGLVRVAEEEPFKGARIVRSKGLVAGRGFRNASFTESQLILVSPDCLAHYWQELGHVSHYRRVDIDSLMEI